MRENAFFIVFANALALDVVDHALLVEYAGDRVGTVAKQVQVDIAASADVTRHDAADQPGPKRRQQAHEAEGLESHLAEVSGPFAAFMQSRESLNFIADFGV